MQEKTRILSKTEEFLFLNWYTTLMKKQHKKWHMKIAYANAVQKDILLMLLHANFFISRVCV